MKRIICFICFILLLTPISVLADVGESTQVYNWDVATVSTASELCYQQESINSSYELSTASTGYYLYCVAITCTNEVNVHTIANPLTATSVGFSCSNGNTNPYVSVVASGASGTELASGNACTDTGTYAYATEKLYYNCGQTSSGTSYSSTTTTTTTTAITSPQTGVNNYYVALGSALVVLSVTLYILNKKNAFKKI